MSAADQVLQLFSNRGGEAYFGEEVSILEHSLQTAWQARNQGAHDFLTASALLHDVGHLLHGLPEDVAQRGENGLHELVGNEWLRSRFPLAVTEPVRLHVDAKRYLCFSDRRYLENLSSSSLESLALQGGPFSEGEAERFEANPCFRDAVALRIWDDRAKIPGLVVPPLEDYRDLLERLSCLLPPA